MTAKPIPHKGDRAKITFGRYRGQSGKITWISSGASQWVRLYGVCIGGTLLGFARGEFRLVRQKD